MMEKSEKVALLAALAIQEVTGGSQKDVLPDAPKTRQLMKGQIDVLVEKRKNHHPVALQRRKLLVLQKKRGKGPAIVLVTAANFE